VVGFELVTVGAEVAGTVEWTIVGVVTEGLAVVDVVELDGFAVVEIMGIVLFPSIFDSFNEIIRTNSEIELNNWKFILIVGKQS
jgi:hypothetical protein